MKLTIPFYYTEKWLSGTKEEIWHQLRGGENGIYSITDTRDEWLIRTSNEFPRRVGGAIATYLRGKRIKSIFSVGVGGGGMEYNLKINYPSCEITCSDFEPNTIDRLRYVFIECDRVEVFNLMTEPLTHDYIVMSRVENEFTDEELRGVFERAKSKNILLVLSDYLSLYRAYILWKDNIVSKVSGRRGPLAGYKRTWDALISLCDPFYEVKETMTLGGLKAVLLEKRP